MVGVITDEQSFIALHTVQLDMGQRLDGSGEHQAFIQSANSAAPMGYAHLYQNPGGWCPRNLTETVGNRPRGPQAVDQHVIGAFRSLRPQTRQAGDFGPANELVGENQALDTHVVAQLELGHGRYRQPPATVVELAGEQLRTHGGLGMRRELDAGALDIVLHHREVVAQRGPFQYGHRHGQIAAQQIQASTDQISRPHDGPVKRQPLGARCQTHVCDIAQAQSSPAQRCGFRAMTSISTLASTIRADCTQARAGKASWK